MPSTVITPTRTPLAQAYAAQRKQVADETKSAVPRNSAKRHQVPEDRVTLSSDGSDEDTPSAKLKPSQAVTFEEMQALRATFSVHA